MGNEIKKPITLAKEDLVKNLVDIIQSSNLPPILVEYVLKDIFNEVHALYIRQLQEDTNNYIQQLKELQNEEEKSEEEDKQ